MGSLASLEIAIKNPINLPPGTMTVLISLTLWSYSITTRTAWAGNGYQVAPQTTFGL